jgi:hypothetical protein
MHCSKNLIKFLLRSALSASILLLCTSCACTSRVKNTKQKTIEINPLEIPPVKELNSLRK